MPLSIPLSLTSGDSTAWRDSGLSGVGPDGRPIQYSPATHQLRYAIKGLDSDSLDLAATADGAEWLTRITTAQSAQLSAGVYGWAASIHDGAGNKTTLGTGQITILPNLSTATSPVDIRTTAQQLLSDVEAAISEFLKEGGVQEREIRGRRYRRADLTELIMLRDRLRAQVASEQQAAGINQGLGGRKPLFVRFGGA